MIRIRSPFEAAAYAWAAGHVCLGTTSPRAGVSVWRCAWRDQLVELTFVEDPTAPPPLTVEQFAQVGREVLDTVPDNGALLTRGEVQRAYADALLAGACLTAAGLPTTLADARRTALARALPKAPVATPIAELPLPFHGFAPVESIVTPVAVTELPDPWQVVARADDGRFLLRHPDHSLGWATLGEVDGERLIVEFALLTGQAALTALVLHGFRFEEVQKARLRALVRAGVNLSDLLERGLGEGRGVPLMWVKHGQRTLQWVEVESRDPRFKAALLGVFIEADTVTGLRFFEGVEGYTMLLAAQAHATTLPDPSGQVAERTVLAANEDVTRIAESVRPVLSALVGNAAAIAALAPRPGDAARVFVPALAAQAEQRYLTLWATDPPKLRAPAHEVTLMIAVCPAGFFGTENPLTRGFPEGYARVGSALLPHTVWVAWAYAAGGRTTDYDGLVWVPEGEAGRWVWFASPFRVLNDLV